MSDRTGKVLRQAEVVMKRSFIIMSAFFSVFAVITIFLPVESLIQGANSLFHFLKLQLTVEDNICVRACMLLAVAVLSLLCGLIYAAKRKHTVYQEGKASITLEYGDLRTCFRENKGKPYTVVIPINDHLDTIADIHRVRENSIHGLWLEAMQKAGLSEDAIKNAVPSEYKDKVCPIGTCIAINHQKVNYLLTVIAALDGNVAHCSEEQYLICMQSLLTQIPKQALMREPVYMPVLASGYANTDMQKSVQELARMMTELLRFNASALKNPIHVVIYGEDRHEVSIFV